MNTDFKMVPVELLERVATEANHMLGFTYAANYEECRSAVDELQAMIDAPVSPQAVARQVALSASRKNRIYIAGPMTGLPEFNFPTFNAMAEKLRAQGWHVENPADHGDTEGAEWADYLRFDIESLASCEAIMLLPGWSKSKGANLEVHIAKQIGVTILLSDGAESPQAAQPVAYQRKSKIEGSEWHYINDCDVAEAVYMGYEVRPLYTNRDACLLAISTLEADHE